MDRFLFLGRQRSPFDDVLPNRTDNCRLIGTGDLRLLRRPLQTGDSASTNIYLASRSGDVCTCAENQLFASRLRSSIVEEIRIADQFAPLPRLVRMREKHVVEFVHAVVTVRVQPSTRVDDIRPLMREAAVYIVPLRIGSGTRLKIFEALAMAKAASMERTELLLADNPEQFAYDTVMLLQDEANRAQLGLAGRELVESSIAGVRWRTALTQSCTRSLEATPTMKWSSPNLSMLIGGALTCVAYNERGVASYQDHCLTIYSKHLRLTPLPESTAFAEWVCRAFLWKSWLLRLGITRPLRNGVFRQVKHGASDFGAPFRCLRKKWRVENYAGRFTLRVRGPDSLPRAP